MKKYLSLGLTLEHFIGQLRAFLGNVIISPMFKRIAKLQRQDEQLPDRKSHNFRKIGMSDITFLERMFIFQTNDQNVLRKTFFKINFPQFRGRKKAWISHISSKKILNRKTL